MVELEPDIMVDVVPDLVTRETQGQPRTLTSLL